MTDKEKFSVHLITERHHDVVLDAHEARIMATQASGTLIAIGACRESEEHIIIVAHISKQHINDFIEAIIEAAARSDWPTQRGH